MFGNNSDGGGMGQMTQVMSILRSENGIAELMQQPTYDVPDTGGQASQAEFLADFINIERMDNKRLAEAVGADITIQRMEPETMAFLIQQLVEGESLELIEKLNDLEDQREQILEAVLDEEELDAHRETKIAQLHTRADTHDSEEGEFLDEETAAELVDEDDAEEVSDDDE